MIPAHDSPLAALAFDASGTKLATASEKVCLLWPGRAHLPGSAGSMNPAHLFSQSKLPTGFLFHGAL